MPQTNHNPLSITYRDDWQIPEKLWRFILTRTGMGTIRLKQATRYYMPRCLYTAAVRLDNFLYEKTRLHLADFARECEELYTLQEFCTLVGCKSKLRYFRRRLALRKNKIPPVYPCKVPYSSAFTYYVYHFDIWRWFNMPWRADMMKFHPLRLWRVKNKMTYAMAGDMFGVDSIRYVKMEAGKYRGIDPARFDELGVSYFACKQWLRNWNKNTPPREFSI